MIRNLFGLLLALLLGVPAMQASELPEATAVHLPRWRGFNLLEMFTKGKEGRRPLVPFREDDFRQIAALGFNFVRLPLDYRFWIKDHDWNRLDEDGLKNVDQAVAWGKKYGIHVCINFHRAPGYCCNPPKEPTNLWTDPETQKICALHWAAFAKRYKGIPSKNLSFNLFNEPGDVGVDAYTVVAIKMIQAIRAEDPDRLIISDGIAGGTTPDLALRSWNVGQSTRGYAPHYISHYKAPWAGDPDGFWAEPIWPKPMVNAVLSGPDMGLDAPLVLQGGFSHGGLLKVEVKQSSDKALLKILANGKTLLKRQFPERPDQVWKVIPEDQRHTWSATIPAGTTNVALTLEGGYLVISKLTVQPQAQKESILPLSGEQWDMRQSPIVLTDSGSLDLKKTSYYDKDWMWNNFLAPWVALAASGVGVHVGEFACYNKTPHATTLAWMEDWLSNWKRAGFGWAMWNFRGAMGILDSERADAEYVDFEGHKLDKKMLELLQKY